MKHAVKGFWLLVPNVCDCFSGNIVDAVKKSKAPLSAAKGYSDHWENGHEKNGPGPVGDTLLLSSGFCLLWLFSSLTNWTQR